MKRWKRPKENCWMCVSNAWIQDACVLYLETIVQNSDKHLCLLVSLTIYLILTCSDYSGLSVFWKATLAAFTGAITLNYLQKRHLCKCRWCPVRQTAYNRLDYESLHINLQDGCENRWCSLLWCVVAQQCMWRYISQSLRGLTRSMFRYTSLSVRQR